MTRNKYFNTICLACMLAMLTGCEASPYVKPSQGPSETEFSNNADDETAAGTAADADTQADAANVDKKYITIDKVKAIVLGNAGYAEKNVRFVRFKLVSENSRGTYDVEFVSDTAEYGYIVDAITGEILSMNCEMGKFDIESIPSDIAQADSLQSGNPQDTDRQDGNALPGSQQAGNAPSGTQQAGNAPAGTQQTGNAPSGTQQAGNTPSGTQQAGNASAGTQQTGNAPAGGQHDVNTLPGHSQHSSSQNGADNQYIGREAAQQAALAHAGLDAGAVRFAHTHLEFEDGRWQYDVEFHIGNAEYDYDIDALTGEVLSYDCDAEYINPGSSTAPDGEYITQEQAKQLALAHAGISESDAQYLKIELDYDDGRAEYEVEWNVGRMEYSCDVDAYTGQILSFERELD